MSILKFVNDANDRPTYLHDMWGYVTNPCKTDDGKLVEVYGCSKVYPIEEMMALKRLMRNTGGRQGIQLIISPSYRDTIDDKSLDDSRYIELGYRVVRLISEYQAFYALHKNTDYRHLHIIFNSVNYKTGNKWTMSPNDLKHIRKDVSDILLKLDFNPILKSTKDFWKED